MNINNKMKTGSKYYNVTKLKVITKTDYIKLKIDLLETKIEKNNQLKIKVNETIKRNQDKLKKIDRLNKEYIYKINLIKSKFKFS